MSDPVVSDPVVAIKNLRIALPNGAERTHAVDGVSFDLTAGKIVCVVGESGSGKSMCAHALLGLLPDTVKVDSGEIRFDGRDLLTVDEDGWRDLRGRRIAMVFQEPMTALNPLMRIGDQLMEVFEAHDLLTPRERRAKALALVREVGLPDPERIIRAYPHQLSGGQRQRAMIAMALALEPAVLVADEPTTALDVTTQAQILKLIRNLQASHNMAVMFITHDFGVVADIADQVVVLRHGRVVEEGTAAAVLGSPQHDYTKALLAAVPSFDPPPRQSREAAPRAVEVIGLDKTYLTPTGWFRPKRETRAAHAVHFAIHQGETLGLVGESGSGKSSVARLVMRLIEADRGTVRIGDVDLTALEGRALRAQRHRIQMIFQDPFASLNPRRKVGRIIADGMVARGTPLDTALKRAQELLAMVGLDAGATGRYPHEFSGGQRQRIGIARALALDPEIIVADEAVSALDVSVQAQVLRLLEDLKARLGLSMLFITHDLRVAAQICDRIAVMQKGEIVELKPTAALFANPEHAYTRELLAAVPRRRPEMAVIS
ncbi:MULTISPECIES: ABC transporter ATP-binding protein [Bradyrhizobium]|jgi:peptide/nickel transport system ATP-binding protein|uniref:ABC transporter ATP-binding protein n=3 Tax=Bradyrhizobium TaxID=374 RepID=A0ABS5FZ89_9BRAD|nr:MULTISPECIES: ABC transporter ATP-binding protein [Bradyrhizobium]MBR1134357.1 ABC transporter ATP-binding protein [Bradyrhizobium denitrificans]MDU1491174.1 ABC transporter ATP-binding protein [Bradyrhizobium sp.]MDU1541352.1 ABC transporter ATP-binding protein [Bradyrhizobium sp.]MDU1803054.1 ABC transporter ATP-binding protein [Bradyrhizobium sp.]MDU2927644.1 ABC transporter ATP-binding protein [Bradyrhizobium sp.]